MTVTNSYRSSVWFALILLILCAPTRSFGQAISTTDLSSGFFRAGAGLSMGGAYRAIADTTQAILYNPAGIALKPGETHAALDYAYQGDVSANLYGAGIVDFQTSPHLAYGLSFHRYTPTIAGIESDVNQAILAFGYTFQRFIQLGTSLKGYWVNIDSPVLQGPRGMDLDAGLLITPLPLLSFGLTGYNLIRGDNVEEFPLMMGLAGALHLRPHLALSADMVRNFQTPSNDKTNYNLGADFLVAESMHLRGGFAFDRVAHNNFYSLAAVFDGPKADLMFAFSQRLSPATETYAVTFDFKF